MQTGTQAHVRLINYRADGSTFNNMISFRPLFDREGHMLFMIALNIEVIDSFSRMKPLLMQMHRLDQLLPEVISLPVPPSVRERVSLVHQAMLAERAKLPETATDIEETELEEEKAVKLLHTATEKAVMAANKRIREHRAKAGRVPPISGTSSPRTSQDLSLEDQSPRLRGLTVSSATPAARQSRDIDSRGLGDGSLLAKRGRANTYEISLPSDPESRRQDTQPPRRPGSAQPRQQTQSEMPPINPNTLTKFAWGIAEDDRIRDFSSQHIGRQQR